MGGWEGAVTAFEVLLETTRSDEVLVEAVLAARFEIAFVDTALEERTSWLAAKVYDLKLENVVPSATLLTNTVLPITVFVWPDIIERVLSWRLTTYVFLLVGDAKVRIVGYLPTTLCVPITVFVWPDIIERVLSWRLRTYTLALYWFKAMGCDASLWTMKFSESPLAPLMSSPTRIVTELIVEKPKRPNNNNISRFCSFMVIRPTTDLLSYP